MSMVYEVEDPASHDCFAPKALRRCFSQGEWEQLLADPAFVAALSDIEDLDQVERFVSIGIELLQDQRLKELKWAESHG